MMGNNRLDSSTHDCHDSRRLLSLHDIMEKYDVGAIARIIAEFWSWETAIAVKRREIGEVSFPEDLKSTFVTQMSEALETCKEITVIECEPFLRTAESRVTADGTTLGMVESEIRHVKESILKELSKWQFVPIRPELTKYFEQDALFGTAVFTTFADARDDIRESGNCIAVEANTAAVFHLMRVAEHGLRRIAKKLRVRLIHSGQSHPVEHADWNKIITGVQNKIAHIKQLSPGSKRQAQLEMYSDAADHCLFMKDIWP